MFLVLTVSCSLFFHGAGAVSVSAAVTVLSKVELLNSAGSIPWGSPSSHPGQETLTGHVSPECLAWACPYHLLYGLFLEAQLSCMGGPHTSLTVAIGIDFFSLSHHSKVTVTQHHITSISCSLAATVAFTS